MTIFKYTYIYNSIHIYLYIYITIHIYRFNYMYISICISEEKEHGSKLTPCQCQACSDPVFKPGICRRRRPTWADR